MNQPLTVTDILVGGLDSLTHLVREKDKDLAGKRNTIVSGPRQELSSYIKRFPYTASISLSAFWKMKLS